MNANNEDLPEMKYALSATIRLHTDKDFNFYKTESNFDASGAAFDEEEEMPVDLVLATIVELRRLSNRLADTMEITEEQIQEFVEERKLICEEKKDNIDETISTLFDDEGEDEA